MSRAVFQAGLSWAHVDRQWNGLQGAFDDFNPKVIARYGAADVERLAATPGIAHSERKVQATIHNARTMLDLEKRHGSFAKYLKSFRTYEELSADIKHRFSHVGDVSAYYFLFRVGERVPPFARWSQSVKGEHPRIREMVGQREKKKAR